MSVSFRPAVREKTPLIIGLAGPTKSGKTYSALRVAQGIANGGTVAMINAEGARGHQYADRFTYVAADIAAPYTPKKYTEAVLAAQQLNPAVLIIDSMSHMHDGPGGMLEMHDSIADRMAGGDRRKKERVTWAAWIEPKRDENEFIYTMLSLNCAVVLCFRAKEKIKIVPGKEPIDLGWQPIASDRVAFETLFTLMLPPHSKGRPDMALSDMREPFDTLIKGDVQIDEALGRMLAQWAAGGAVSTPATPRPAAPAEGAFLDGAQRKVLSKIWRDAGHEDGVVKEYLQWKYQIASSQQIPVSLYAALGDRFASRASLSEEMLAPPPAEAAE